MERNVDLHIHTTASDGAFRPSEIVKFAVSSGLAAISITDHDTLGGINEAVESGKRLGVEVIPGIELSSIYDDKYEVHILGYYIDSQNKRLNSILKILKDARYERAKKMVDQLNSAGVNVSFQRVMEIADGGAIGRPHVARAICESGIAKSMGAVFGKYLVEGCVGFVEKYKLPSYDAVNLIAGAGGVPICAHVAKLKRDNIIIDLISRGLRGIEVYHPDHGSASTRFYRKFAERRKLIATGGSDAHCFDGVNGTCVGDIRVPYEIVDNLKRAAGLL